MLALLASRTNDFANPTFSGFHRAVIEFGCKRSDAFGQRFADLRDYLGDFDRQLRDRLGVGGLFAGEVLVPHLA